jgi:hypothetical protein
LEPPQQAFQTNQTEFPPLTRPTQSKKAGLGSNANADATKYS